MARSLKKGPYVFKRLLKKVQELADLVNIIESLPYFTTRKLYFYLYEN